jgi:hypothetical protein
LLIIILFFIFFSFYLKISVGQGRGFGRAGALTSFARRRAIRSSPLPPLRGGFGASASMRFAEGDAPFLSLRGVLFLRIEGGFLFKMFKLICYNLCAIRPM